MTFATRRKIALGLMSFGLTAIGVFSALPVAAVGWYTIVPECARPKAVPGASVPPAPSLNCLLTTFGNVGSIILGLTGSAALLMFVYGGFRYLTGTEDGVKAGKAAIKNAVIGLVIIMTAGIIIQYSMQQMGLNKGWAIGQICEKDGQMIQTPDGTLKCVHKCEDGVLKQSGYKCIKTAEKSGAHYCIADLCPGDRNEMCCR